MLRPRESCRSTPSLVRRPHLGPAPVECNRNSGRQGDELHGLVILMTSGQAGFPRGVGELSCGPLAGELRSGNIVASLKGGGRHVIDEFSAFMNLSSLPITY